MSRSQSIFKKVLLNRYSSNTIWLLAGKASEMLLSLITGVLIARYLSESDYGLYNYVLSIVTIFTIFSNLGLSSIVTKDIINEKFETNSILGSTFFLKLLGAVLSVLGALLTVVLLDNEPVVYYYVLFASVPILIKTIDVISYFFDSKVLSKYNVFAKTISVFVSSAIKLSMIIFQLDIWILYSSLVADAFIYCLILFILYQKHSDVKLLDWSVNKRVAISLLKNSWPLLFMGVVSVFYQKIDQIMIMEMLSAELLGHYSAAVKLSSQWYSIPWLIVGSVFPALLNAYKKSETVYNMRYALLLRFLILLALFAIIPVTLFSEQIIAVLYKNKYSGAADVLSIHIWAGLFVFIGFAGTKWLISIGAQYISLVSVVVGAIVNVVLNIVFIPEYGINGAAVVTLISQAVNFIIMPVFFTKSRKLFVMQIVAFVNLLNISALKRELKAVFAY